MCYLITKYYKNLGKYMKRRKERSDVTDNMLICTTITTCILTSLLLLFLFVDPHGSIIVGAVRFQSTTFFIKLLLRLVHFYAILVIMGATCFFLCYLNIFGYIVIQLYTVELRFGLKYSKYLTKNILRNCPHNLVIAYRQFQILHQHIFFIHGPLLISCHGLITMNGIYGNFVLIRYWNTLENYAMAPVIFQNLFTSVIWIGVMEIGIFLYNRGNKLLDSWKRKMWDTRLERRIMTKFRLSCKPLLFAYGSMFVVKSHSLMLFYKQLSRGTFRALLTLKNY